MAQYLPHPKNNSRCKHVPTVTEQMWWFNFPSIGSYQTRYSLENGSGLLERRGQADTPLEPGSNSLKISHGFKPYQLRDDIGIQVQRSLVTFMLCLKRTTQWNNRSGIRVP